MKRIVQTLLLATITVLSLTTTASATTYKWFHCDKPAGQECSFDYTLGKSATKEFRVDCTGTNWSIPDNGITVDAQDKGTTCTVSTPWTGYTSKSCTNWDPFTSDHVVVKVKCRNRLE